MRNILFLFILIPFLAANAQKKNQFLDDFKLNPKLLEGMVIASIPEKYSSKGITGNPAVTKDKRAIKMLSADNDSILQVYYEVYYNEDDNSDDAGVVVSRFSSEEALKDCLPTLRHQSNLAYLIKDNYLIMVWSDKSEKSEEQISDMVNYYKDKLNAEVYPATDHFACPQEDTAEVQA